MPCASYAECWPVAIPGDRMDQPISDNVYTYTIVNMIVLWILITLKANYLLTWIQLICLNLTLVIKHPRIKHPFELTCGSFLFFAFKSRSRARLLRALYSFFSLAISFRMLLLMCESGRFWICVVRRGKKIKHTESWTGLLTRLLCQLQ